MLRQKLNNFFIGRNGQDQFGLFLLALSIIFSFIGVWVCTLISWIILSIAIFRMVSKNVMKRRRENLIFMKAWQKVKRPFNNMKATYNERKFYKIYKCPKCRQKLRVPKYKGKVKVRCSKCGEAFIRKT